MDEPLVTRPPTGIRMRYYLFEVRLPPAYLAWAERDIGSHAWLVREVARLVALFALMTLITGRITPAPGGWVVLIVGVVAIVASGRVLRRIALAHQRYGPEWEQARAVGSPSLRIALAVVFATVFVLLAR